jgi:hypothetical protein
MDNLGIGAYVVHGTSRERGLEMPKDLMLRRRALEIVTQLPETPAEARRVLEYARGLVDGFLCAQDASGGRIPSLRAIVSDSPAVSLSSIQPVVTPLICRAKD